VRHRDPGIQMLESSDSEIAEFCQKSDIQTVVENCQHEIKNHPHSLSLTQLQTALAIRTWYMDSRISEMCTCQKKKQTARTEAGWSAQTRGMLSGNQGTLGVNP